jgi:hypothetical protein
MDSSMRIRGALAVLAVLVYAGIRLVPGSTGHPPAHPAGVAQTPGSCVIGPPEHHFRTGEWTATETILRTSAIDGCNGERRLRPLDFRRGCVGRVCTTVVYTESYYGVDAGEVRPLGHGHYVVNFPPSGVPCPHRPGEDAGINRAYETFTLWWSRSGQELHGMVRDAQVGPCGGGPAEVSSFVAVRSDPTAVPPAEGP